MEAQEIEVVIDKNGQVRLHVRGASGETCLDLTAGVEEALGGMVISRELTSDTQGSGTVELPQEERIKQNRRR